MYKRMPAVLKSFQSAERCISGLELVQHLEAGPSNTPIGTNYNSDIICITNCMRLQETNRLRWQT